MAISHHHMAHHHKRHHHVAPPAVLQVWHGDVDSFTFRLPDGNLVTVDLGTATVLCKLNTCEGAR